MTFLLCARRFLICTLPALLIGCSTMSPKSQTTAETQDFQIFSLASPPVLGESAQKQPILTGGFSGLYFEGKTESQTDKYLTVTDRGPNTNPKKYKGQEKRPFLLPNFTPEIIHLEALPKTKELRILQRIPITSPKGNLIHGLPNNAKDERPSDAMGNDLPRELQGLDIEGITKDREGNYWVCEEYRPSILKINPQGQILNRFIPKNSFSPEELKELRRAWGPKAVQDILPELFSQRRANRGFEGITFHQGKIIAALQSPLSEGDLEIPWLIFDPVALRSEVVNYRLDDQRVDKIGDIASDGEKIFVIEQNSEMGAKAVKKIFQVRLPSQLTTPRTILEKTLTYDISIHPRRLHDYDHEKLEGLAVVDSQHLALIHDNDFGFTGALDKKTGQAELNSDPSINLLKIKIPQKN